MTSLLLGPLALLWRLATTTLLMLVLALAYIVGSQVGLVIGWEAADTGVVSGARALGMHFLWPPRCAAGGDCFEPLSEST